MRVARSIRPLAGLSLMVALGFTAWIAIVSPVQVELETTRAALDRERALKAKLTTTLARLEREAGRLEQTGGDPPAWRGERLGEVSARIQADLSRTARNLGLTVRSIASTEAARIAESPATGIRLELEAPLDKAAAMLRGIEDASPPVIVTRLNMRRLNRQLAQNVQPIVFLRLELAAPVIVGNAPQ